MNLVIEMQAVGGPDVLRAVDREVPPPGPGEVRLRHSVIGVGFVDIYHRTGLYPLPSLPAVPGIEGAGVVEAVGDGVATVRPGDRVAYAGVPPGAYAQIRNIPEARVVRLPDSLSERSAGSAMLRGITAYMLLHKVFALRPGQFVLVPAAAGGLGQFVTRWATRLGARVIGTVGSPAKRALAEAAGAEAVFLHSAPDWPDAVRDRAEGLGVHLACDGIGGAAFERVLSCVRPFGMVASLGQAGGPIPPLDVAALGPVRSISLSRPSVIAFSKDPALYRPAAAELFAVLADGLASPIGAEYPLSDAAQAHRDLEAGRTTGSIILLP